MINSVIHSNVEAPPEIIAILQKGVSEASDLLKSSRRYQSRIFGFFTLFNSLPDVDSAKKAIDLAIKSREVLINTLKNFEIALNNYNKQAAAFVDGGYSENAA